MAGTPETRFQSMEDHSPRAINIPLASPRNSENIGNKKLTLVSPIFEPTHPNLTGYMT